MSDKCPVSGCRGRRPFSGQPLPEQAPVRFEILSGNCPLSGATGQGPFSGQLLPKRGPAPTLTSKNLSERRRSMRVYLRRAAMSHRSSETKPRLLRRRERTPNLSFLPLLAFWRFGVDSGSRLPRLELPVRRRALDDHATPPGWDFVDGHASPRGAAKPSASNCDLSDKSARDAEG